MNSMPVTASAQPALFAHSFQHPVHNISENCEIAGLTCSQFRVPYRREGVHVKDYEKSSGK